METSIQLNPQFAITRWTDEFVLGDQHFSGAIGPGKVRTWWVGPGGNGAHTLLF